MHPLHHTGFFSFDCPCPPIHTREEHHSPGLAKRLSHLVWRPLELGRDLRVANLGVGQPRLLLVLRVVVRQVVLVRDREGLHLHHRGKPHTQRRKGKRKGESATSTHDSGQARQETARTELKLTWTCTPVPMGELPLTVPWYVGWTVARLPIGAARKLWPVLELSTAVAVAVVAVAVAREAPVAVAVGAGAAKEGQVGEEEKEDAGHDRRSADWTTTGRTLETTYKTSGPWCEKFVSRRTARQATICTDTDGWSASQAYD